MKMRLLRAADHKRMPWKNGGGETVEIAIFPPDAGLNGFAWRVSTATVASDGPFSSFPGVDRTLAVLSGAAVTLMIEGREPVTLDQRSRPFSFPADAPTSAMLVDGPITDLNVMTRRGRFMHGVDVLAIPSALPMSPHLRLLLCRQGRLDIACGADRLALETLDCLMLEPDMKGEVSVSGEAEAFLIALEAL